MPLYEYESRDGLVRAEYIRSIKDRDKPAYLGTVRLYRVTAPSRVAVVGIASDPTDQKASVMKGYKKMEEQMGSRFMKHSEFTKKEIKQIWSE